MQTYRIFQPYVKASSMCPSVLPSVLPRDSFGNKILGMGGEGIGTVFQQIPGLHNGRMVFHGSERNWVSSLDVDFSKIFCEQKQTWERNALRGKVNSSKVEASEKRADGIL